MPKAATPTLDISHIEEFRLYSAIAKQVRTAIFALDAKHQDEFVTDCIMDKVMMKKNKRVVWADQQIAAGDKWGQTLAFIYNEALDMIASIERGKMRQEEQEERMAAYTAKREAKKAQKSA